MAYIGKTPVIGNFVKLDAISVVNGQAAYTMQNGGVNFTSYDNVNQFLVSLNGILQSPTDSFTVSSSTITFASNLVTGDVIDFIIVLGNTLDVGVPSDNTVSTAKLQDSSVSLAKLTATGTKDATTFLRGDNTFAEAGGEAGKYAFYAGLDTNQNLPYNTVTTFIGNETYVNDGSKYSTSTGRYTPGEVGKYFVTFTWVVNNQATSDMTECWILLNNTGTRFGQIRQGGSNASGVHLSTSAIINITSITDYISCVGYQAGAGGASRDFRAEMTYFGGFKIA